MNTFQEGSLILTGCLDIILTDAQGNIKDKRFVNNMVMTAGKGFIASRMKDATATVMSHMGIGTSAAATNASQTILQGPETTPGATYTRATISSTTVVGAQITYTATFAANNPTTQIIVREAGIFNAASAGTMLCRTTFADVTKEPADTLQINWTVTVN